jgi:acyl-CoA synthetase (AMP-forming)/AMP-acid ligase II/acyl carrier protein
MKWNNRQSLQTNMQDKSLNQSANPWWWTLQANTADEAPALLDDSDGIITRGQLRSTVISYAANLASQGVRTHDRIAFAMPAGPEMAITLLAAMKIGAAAPMMTSITEEQAREDLKRLKATHIIADTDTPRKILRAAATANIPAITLNHSAYDYEQSDTSSQLDPSRTVLLLQTSGTTSKPKVVPLSHDNLTRSAENIVKTLGLTEKDRSLAAMPLFHIHGIVASLIAPLISGGSVICPQSSLPQKLLELIHELEPTWTSLVPTMLQGLLIHKRMAGGPNNQHKLRIIRTSSAALPSKLFIAAEKEFGVPIIESYGMTEAAHQICSNRPPGAAPERIPGSVGPAAGPELIVLGAERTPLPVGECGEVAIRGTNVTQGYENAVDTGWVTLATGEKWFLTGDEGYQDKEGRLFLTGRLKEMINRGGEKIIPRRVDEALLQHPDVDQAVAFSVPHPTLGEDLVAAVVLGVGGSVGEQELRQHAFCSLSPHEVPSTILFLEELPRGVTGKLQRIGLADRLAGALCSRNEPPIGEIEELVASVIGEVLEQAPPGRDANFFLLGGDSLSGTRVVIRLAERLGLDLNPTLLFTVPTVSSLAERLDQLLEETLSKLEGAS